MVGFATFLLDLLQMKPFVANLFCQFVGCYQGYCFLFEVQIVTLYTGICFCVELRDILQEAREVGKFFWG